MLHLRVGHYEYSVWPGLCNYRINFHPADQSDTDLFDQVKRYDDMLHETIVKIFHERCLGSSDRIKEFLRESQHHTYRNPVIKSILQPIPNNDLKKLSLLWISVLAGYEKSAELLVLSGADVNELFGCHSYQVIDEKWTVLHLLLNLRPFPENERLICLVTDHGADLQARDAMGKTVLRYAIERRRILMTEMLLEKGTDVNAADCLGLTPLLVAAYKPEVNELVPLLMKHGADVFAKSRDHENVLHRLAQVDPQIHVAELARLFIGMGVSPVDETKNFQLQPIHFATKRGNDELVNLFLDHGVDVNAQAHDGMIPLNYAASREHCAAVMETLIKRGANVNHQKYKFCTRTLSNTALHSACEYLCENNIRMLLSAGADVLIKNHKGMTPLAMLLSVENRENSSGVRSIIEVLALKKVCQPTIELKDERIIKKYSMLWIYYQDCVEEIDQRMKSTRFIETCTFYELLTKCQCRIAALMRNPNFETKFRQYDLSDFTMYYAEVITQAFERAQNYYHSMLEQEEVITEAVYHSLPYVVVRRIAHYICNCCEDRK